MHDPLPHQQAWSHISDMLPLLDLADHVIVHAEDNQRQLLERRPDLENRVSVVPHGPLFTQQALPGQKEARSRLKLEPQAVVVLFFGLVKPYKGLEDLIQAMAEIRSKNPRLRLVVAGQVSGSEEPYVDAIRKHGLQDITSLHLRFIPSDLVPYYFGASDLVCLPYRQASQSGVLMAAYHFGRPVVVTDVGGLPETVEDGGNGYVVPAREPRSLAQAVERLVADPDLRRRFGQRSRELAETRFGWTNAARLTQTIYKQLASQT
jgi:glycosyltransferase involved in cell wall biosynthesis